jgi:outer membrane biosynthesis protein TonB
MQNNLSPLIASFRSLSYQRKFTIVSALVLVIMLPAVLLVVSQEQNLASKADTTTLVEAESGTISGNATLKTSDSASGGKYILLNPQTTVQPPTPTTYKAPTPSPTKWPPTPTPHPYATSTPRPTPRPTLRPTAFPTPRPTNRPTPTPTPTPGHGNGNGQGDHH